jgi:hypothetical protein
VPAKRDLNPRKLKLRLLFFSSLIFTSFRSAPYSDQAPGEAVYLNRRFEYSLEVGRIAAEDPITARRLVNQILDV